MSTKKVILAHPIEGNPPLIHSGTQSDPTLARQMPLTSTAWNSRTMAETRIIIVILSEMFFNLIDTQSKSVICTRRDLMKTVVDGLLRLVKPNVQHSPEKVFHYFV